MRTAAGIVNLNLLTLQIKTNKFLALLNSNHRRALLNRINMQLLSRVEQLQRINLCRRRKHHSKTQWLTRSNLITLNLSKSLFQTSNPHQTWEFQSTFPLCLIVWRANKFSQQASECQTSVYLRTLRLKITTCQIDLQTWALPICISQKRRGMILPRVDPHKRE